MSICTPLAGVVSKEVSITPPGPYFNEEKLTRPDDIPLAVPLGQSIKLARPVPEVSQQSANLPSIEIHHPPGRKRRLLGVREARELVRPAAGAHERQLVRDAVAGRGDAVRQAVPVDCPRRREVGPSDLAQRLQPQADLLAGRAQGRRRLECLAVQARRRRAVNRGSIG